MSKILIDEAVVRRAMEALEQIAGAMPFPVGKQSIAALRQALSDSVEQPAPAQEPVALAKAFNDGVLEGTLREREHWLKQPPAPAQSWVGLTVAEQNELCRKTGASRHQVRSVEAKLKEKNTSAHGITKGNT
jgi:hypothetical protein